MTINLDLSINSGQVFLWRRAGRVWTGVNGNQILRLDGSRIRAGGAEGRFLRMDDDYNAIISEISTDSAMQDITAQYRGLRLLRQDPFQCCISFIVSANSNIGRIRTGLGNIASRFGEKKYVADTTYCLFPGPESLAGASVSDLRRCGIGYRAAYVREAARLVHLGKIDLESLRTAGYHDAKQEIMQIPGVGNKVADCILLFSLDKTEAFPLDRWMQRALQMYPEFDVQDILTDSRYDALHEKIVDRFGRFAGYAQQFLFRHIRDQNQKQWS